MIAELENRILDLIDSNVEHASDDELFAGGYLRGHITLAAAQAEEQGSSSLSDYAQLIEQSLDKAIKAGELSPPDQVLVFNLWKSLQQKVE
ncbi:YfcL family protein [Budviciaceae bacterium BWR-B9]|uniref:YfcL family protein n=1 Tax=Limnobaculum allomyrinae TaxID=2791986 RepID=A0ABS1IVW6_9GAMM|nr:MULTISPECIES: YfcL family protein [Limnobaculum]MBK5145908.1 YfcL family protein [Limnobaculum allomyrinae]MBV7693942.1 YfcL family protein [Limnobaculum sp. M2-1]